MQIGPLVFIMNQRDMTKDSLVIRTAENYAVRVGYNRDVFKSVNKDFFRYHINVEAHFLPNHSTYNTNFNTEISKG